MAENLWDEAAAASYDTPGTGMFASEVVDPAVDRLVELSAGGAVLEFAVGTGRIALPLAERGVAVSGIELSEPMVKQLRSKEGGAAMPIVIGDMATTTVPGEFSLVYLVFNTITNLLTQDEQVACFENAARHLLPGGRFVIENGVPELRKLPVGGTGVVFGGGDGYLGVDTYDPVAQHLTSHHVRFGAGRDASLFRSRHRYVWPSELDLMARIAGFELESRAADWIGSTFTGDSESHVSVYRLKG